MEDYHTIHFHAPQPNHSTLKLKRSKERGLSTLVTEHTTGLVACLRRQVRIGWRCRLEDETTSWQWKGLHSKNPFEGANCVEW